MLRSASVAKPCTDSTLRLFATIPHEGSGLVAGSSWRRRQFFPVEGALRRYRGEPKHPLIATIGLPADDLARATSARLRLVSDADGTEVMINERHSLSCPRDLPVTDLPVPLDALEPGENVLAFTAPEGFLLGSCSLILDGPDPAPQPPQEP